jgi:uncharacterized membrane protein
VALALGYVVPHISERWLPGLGTPLGRDQLIAFLSSVATGMMAFTGIVFSLLLVLPQFGTVAYTPRIVSLWIEDRTIANAAGVFTGTFLYSLMALRAVGLFQGSKSCALTMYIAFAWLLASLWMLTRLLRVFTGLTHSSVLCMLGRQGVDAIDRTYPNPLSARGNGGARVTPPVLPERPTQVVVHEGPPLYVVRIDVDRLVRIASRSLATIRLLFAPGDSVTAGATLALVYSAGDPVSVDQLLEAITLGPERILRDDPKYALRMLVDVAVRALSAAVNDPTTTVQALDQIEALLVKLGSVELDIGQARDSGLELRLVYDATTWEEYLELALVEIQYYGASSLQTERRLTALFAFLRDHIPPSRRAAVGALAQQHVTAAANAFPGLPPWLAARGDRQGLGHTLQ